MIEGSYIIYKIYNNFQKKSILQSNMKVIIIFLNGRITKNLKEYHLS